MFTKLAKSLFAFALTALAFSPVYGEGDQFYAGGSLARIDYSEPSAPDFSLNVAVGRFGVRFTENFAAEIRGGIGLGDDTNESTITNADFSEYAFFGIPLTTFGISGTGNASGGGTLELDHFFGAYLRAGAPIGESFFPYALLGYTRADISASVSLSVTPQGGQTSAASVNVSGSDTDISFGLGADYKFNDRFSLNAEWINYVDKSDGELGELSGFSVGALFNF